MKNKQQIYFDKLPVETSWKTPIEYELGSYEKRCTCCGKIFMVQNLGNYVYKIEDSYGHTRWYCRYNCWRLGQKVREKEIQINRERREWK